MFGQDILSTELLIMLTLAILGILLLAAGGWRTTQQPRRKTRRHQAATLSLRGFDLIPNLYRRAVNRTEHSSQRNRTLQQGAKRSIVDPSPTAEYIEPPTQEIAEDTKNPLPLDTLVDEAEASFVRSYPKNWAYRDLNHIRLRGVNLSKSDLRGANLAGNNLTGTQFVGASLAYADFTDASLVDADLTDADCTGARFHGANLQGARLCRADLTGARFRPARWPYRGICGGNFLTTGKDHLIRLPGANLTEADLTGAQTAGSDIKQGYRIPDCTWTQWPAPSK